MIVSKKKYNELKKAFEELLEQYDNQVETNLETSNHNDLLLNETRRLSDKVKIYEQKYTDEEGHEIQDRLIKRALQVRSKKLTSGKTTLFASNTGRSANGELKVETINKPKSKVSTKKASGKDSKGK